MLQRKRDPERSLQCRPFLPDRRRQEILGSSFGDGLRHRVARSGEWPQEREIEAPSLSPWIVLAALVGQSGEAAAGLLFARLSARVEAARWQSRARRTSWIRSSVHGEALLCATVAVRAGESKSW